MTSSCTDYLQGKHLHTGKFPLQRSNNTHLWCLFSFVAVEQTVELPVIWACMTPIGRDSWSNPILGSARTNAGTMMIGFASLNTLRPKQNCRYFADDIFTCIFLNENAWISLNILLQFVPKVRFSNIPALVQLMARPGDKPLSEPMMVSLLTQICVTRPQ